MSLDSWTGALPTAAETADTDAWLLRLMQSPKNKAMLASLEQMLHDFVSDISQTQLPFPPRSSFHRKVCSLVARRYGLAHRLEPFDDGDSASEPKVRLVLLKTPQSAVPTKPLAELVGEGRKMEEEGGDKAVPTSTKFLRRLRSADGKATKFSKPLGGAGGERAATLRSISEEDYRKARARIFKCAENSEGSRETTEQPQESNGETGKLARIPQLAKGPVEGSTGFDRRRNRRNLSAQVTQPVTPSDKQQQQRWSSSSERQSDSSRPPLHGENSKGVARSGVAPYSRGEKESQGGQEQGARLNGGSGGIANGNGGGGNGVYSGNGARRQGPYGGAGLENNERDRQDPDFDRRYDKWAVRMAPPPPPHTQQHVPVPIFGQLLYPYSVQAGSQHLHPSGLHLRSAGSQMRQANMGQYQSIQLHQTPGAMVFQHLGQGIGGLAEYAGRSLSLADHASPYDVAATVEHLGISHSREMSTLQHQTLPSQVTRTPAPAYGLDSTVDFPPLQ